MCCLTIAAHGQHTFKALIKGERRLILNGATVTWKEQDKTVVADSSGFVSIRYPGWPSDIYHFLRGI